MYHRRSIRLKGYDYSQAGLYFITINTKERKHLFGKIGLTVGAENFLPQPGKPPQPPRTDKPYNQNQPPKMILNDAGIVANKCWLEIPDHFPDAVLHEYIIMPNHIHGIIELNRNHVRAENFLPLQPQPNNPPRTYKPDKSLRQNEFQKMIPHSIGSIIRGYKIGVTKWYRKNNELNGNKPPQIWQRNYYEHIIRNEDDYKRITEYIINNPRNWKKDELYEE
jgi:REP element-mobilizing transposase RayT